MGALRILLSVLGAIISSLVLFFIVTVFVQPDPLPHVLMPEQKRNLRALKEREHRKRASRKKHPSENQVFAFTGGAEYG